MASRDETAAFLQEQIQKEQAGRLTAEAELEAVKESMKALIQEFTEAPEDETPAKVRKNIRGRIPTALEVLDELMVTGKEATKASIAKFFIEKGLAEPGESSNKDKSKTLLEQLLDD